VNRFTSFFIGGETRVEKFNLRRLNSKQQKLTLFVLKRRKRFNIICKKSDVNFLTSFVKRHVDKYFIQKNKSQYLLKSLGVNRSGPNPPNSTSSPHLAQQKPDFRLKNVDMGLKIQDSCWAGHIFYFLKTPGTRPTPHA
jgi:hypothetical protein